ncbi:hypothetical protein SSYRP_v1c00150 [Spiroplasma syrphidicola EA-1]|uniref:Transmembrane protein n=1 Tax=Spiroplasma syrphidicola EA-1 TaxID=1276229 RepID=R4UJX6_9MOLU|nr:hypothetical protein [Spiroplasma syrphidicola]AGM25611.1 hypothetical protein SSYRP_v1c00150 [Spiroplasma syrphidicola EA-1]
MKINFRKFNISFTTTFLLFFFCYVSFNYLILIMPNTVFQIVSFIFKFLYLIITDIVLLFFLFFWSDILRKFKKHANKKYLFEIIRTNWLIIMIGFFNLIIFAQINFIINLNAVVKTMLMFVHFEEYLGLLIIYYIFYLVLTLIFITNLIIVKVYNKFLNALFFRANDNFATALNLIFETEDILEINDVEIKWYQLFGNQRINFIKQSILIDKLRQSEKIVQFKKETCPPLLIF